MTPGQFRKTILAYYKERRRSMPWRDNTSPYYVVVSEIMLQQTQVDRVRIKFDSFVKKFPDWKSLAKATNHEVLREWSGLGYNRRGLYLKRIAEIVVRDPEYGFLNGKKISTDIPRVLEKLQELPGIGPNTAGSIIVFAFNLPHPFIETNIRSVYIHFFFADSRKKINDADLMPLIEKTMDRKNPREWFYALMDYGSHLKKTSANPSRRSAHHVKQKPFKGSNRELRSGILRTIMEGSASYAVIYRKFASSRSAKEIRDNLLDLEKEGFIKKSGALYQIA